MTTLQKQSVFISILHYDTWDIRHSVWR